MNAYTVKLAFNEQSQDNQVFVSEAVQFYAVEFMDT